MISHNIMIFIRRILNYIRFTKPDVHCDVVIVLDTTRGHGSKVTDNFNIFILNFQIIPYI